MKIDLDDVVCDTYYDPDTGKLYRVKELVATTEYEEGFFRARNLRFDSLTKQSTHIMYFIMTGDWPEKGMHIDHIDGDSSNNKWDNLRQVTPRQNLFNRSQSRDRWNGIDEDLAHGVNKHGTRYYVRIGGQSFGGFDNAKDANEVAIKARHEVHGEYARKPESTPFIRRI